MGNSIRSKMFPGWNFVPLFQCLLSDAQPCREGHTPQLCSTSDRAMIGDDFNH